MQYSECRQGRTFVARLEDGEAIYDAIEKLAEREKIHAATVLAIGGVRRACVVTGPADPTTLRAIVPQVQRFDDAREIVGIGTIFQSQGRPSLHFHAGIGRGETALVGCPREGAECFLILEVVVIEWLGLDSAERLTDAESGFRLLDLGVGARRV
jgi:predicted DNA-binding protein with PD1-like motif